MSKKLGITKVALSALCGLCVAAGALALTPATAAAETTYTDVGSTYYHSYDGTLNSYVNKPAWGSSNYYGTRAELTVAEGTTEATIKYNGTIDPAFKQIITNDCTVEEEATSKAFVVEYRSVLDPTKVLSIIATRDPIANVARITVAFTDQLEFTEDDGDYFAYIKGTNANTMGRNPNYDGTPQSEKYFQWGYPMSKAHMWLDWQLYLTCEGDVKVNESTVVANILDPEFLSASAASLGNHELASRYTVEYATELINSLTTTKNTTGGSGNAANSLAIFSVKYYGIRTSKVAFLLRQIQGKWKPGPDQPLSWVSDRAYADQLVDTLYVGETYKINNELIKMWSTYGDRKYADGFYNCDANAEGGTWYRICETIDKNQNITPTTVGKYYIWLSVQNDFDPATNKGTFPWNIYGKAQVFEFNVIAKPQIDFKVGENSVSGYPVSAMNGDKVTMPTAENTATEVFVGWANGTKLYKAGTQITVDGDATYTALYLGFTTDDKASLRIAENGNGVRFTSHFNKAQTELLSTFDNVAVTFGTVITSNNSTQSIKVESDPRLTYVSADGTTLDYNAAIVNVKDINLTRVYHAQGYLTVTYSDGATATVNAIQTGNEGRSYAQILAAAKADETIGGLLKAAVAAEYERVFASKTLVPSITITVDGADVDEMTFATELNAYFANKTWKIGDTVDLSDITFAGYTVGGTLTGVMTERGLNITIALTTAA